MTHYQRLGLALMLMPVVFDYDGFLKKIIVFGVGYALLLAERDPK